MYESTTTTSRPTVITQPTVEPISLAEARKQLELSPSDTTHDDHLRLLVKAAREQWEHDTDAVVLTTTLEMTAGGFGQCIALPSRPVQSVTHVKYYNTSDALTTVATTVYSLDTTRRLVRLKRDQTWPTSIDRWDAVVVRYVAGYASVADVPALHKQAMLLLVGKYFEQRDMIGNFRDDAYEALVAKYMRSTYP